MNTGLKPSAYADSDPRERVNAVCWGHAGVARGHAGAARASTRGRGALALGIRCGWCRPGDAFVTWSFMGAAAVWIRCGCARCDDTKSTWSPGS